MVDSAGTVLEGPADVNTAGFVIQRSTMTSPSGRLYARLWSFAHPDDYGYMHALIMGELVEHLDLQDMVVMGEDWGGPVRAYVIEPENHDRETSVGFEGGPAMRVAVIGAGIVGVSAALTLAERGVEVVVFDRGEVAGEASGLNAGIIGGGGWGGQPDINVAFRMGSRDRYVDLSAKRGHDIGLDLMGTLTLIRTEDEWDWAKATVEADRSAGHCYELVDSRDLIDLEPAADPDLLGAILDPLGARAEPVAACRAFAAEAIAAGAVIESGCAVTGLRSIAGGSWELSAAGRLFTADAVIIAAGPWCAQVGAMVGVAVPIVAVRGQMWASASRPPVLRHAIAAAESFRSWSTEVPGNNTPPFLTHRVDERVTRHLYGRQRPNGEIVFGGDRVLTDDRTVDDDGIAVNHSHVAELLPMVAALPIARTWAGMMPFSLDGRPVLGSVPGHQGLFLAGGLASGGFGRGPMMGQLISELVMGEETSFDLTTVVPDDRVKPLPA